MSNQQYTYRIKSIISGILIWELIFWISIAGLFYILGYFGTSNGEQVNFKYPDRLWLLLFLIPILIVYLYNIRKNNQLYDLTGEAVRKYMFQPVSTSGSFLKFFLFRNAFVFLILALAQPVFGNKKVKGTVESLELVICLDISNSMNAKDIDSEVSRLEIAKRAINQLINNLHGEKVGICVFANSAFTQLPITIDYHAAKMYVNDIETSMISSQGTNIKAALENSITMFTEDKESAKGVILVTDGENHEENPDEILNDLKEKQIQFVVLGLGTRQGGLIPKNPDRPELGYKTTATGTTVLSKLNPQFIAEIATKGGGYSTISEDPFPNLNGMLEQINKMEKTKMDTQEFDVKENRYRVPLLLSILFWVAYFIWSSNLVRQIDKLAHK